MDKVKIQEIVDEAGLSSGDLLDKAKELGFDVKTANSTISMEDAGILVDYAICGTLPKGFVKPIKDSKSDVVFERTENEIFEWIDENNLEDKIPKIASIIIKLSELDLHGRNLTTIPNNIDKFENLNILNLDQNNLTVIPEKIVDLKLLTVLNLENNPNLKITGNFVNLYKKLKNNGCNIVLSDDTTTLVHELLDSGLNMSGAFADVEFDHSESKQGMTDREFSDFLNSISVDVEYEYINVELTPSKYLTSDSSKYIRSKILNNKENVDWDDFELMYDKFNEYDSFAIQVFYNEIFIGYIKKNQTFLSSSEINNFCFNNQDLREISINWENNTFILKRLVTDDIKKARQNEIDEEIKREKQQKLEEQEREKFKRKQEELEINHDAYVEAKKIIDVPTLRETKQYLLDNRAFWRKGINDKFLQNIEDDINYLSPKESIAYHYESAFGLLLEIYKKYDDVDQKKIKVTKEMLAQSTEIIKYYKEKSEKGITFDHMIIFANLIFLIMILIGIN